MKNIIILGANEGIGYWLAKQLLDDGNNVESLMCVLIIWMN